eukprot:752184-Hanusia_phi.AAC.1
MQHHENDVESGPRALDNCYKQINQDVFAETSFSHWMLHRNHQTANEMFSRMPTAKVQRSCNIMGTASRDQPNGADYETGNKVNFSHRHSSPNTFVNGDEDPSLANEIVQSVTRKAKMEFLGLEGEIFELIRDMEKKLERERIARQQVEDVMNQALERTCQQLDEIRKERDVYRRLFLQSGEFLEMYETQLNYICKNLDQAILHASLTEKQEGNFSRSEEMAVCLTSFEEENFVALEHPAVENADQPSSTMILSLAPCQSSVASGQVEGNVVCDQEYERLSSFQSPRFMFSPRSIGSKVSDELSQCQTADNMDSPCCRDSLRNCLYSVQPVDEHEGFDMEATCKCGRSCELFDDLFVLDEDSAGAEKLYSDSAARHRKFRLLECQEPTRTDYTQMLDKKVERLILSRASVGGHQRALYDAHLCWNLQLLLTDTKNALMEVDGLLKTAWYCEKCEASLFAHKKWQPKPRLRQYMISRRKTVLY